MADKQKYYAPPPRRRSSNVVRKELYRHLKGKPTHSSSLLSIPRVIGIAVSRAVSLFILILVLMAFLLCGLGGGMLIGYITTASPVSTEHIKNSNEMTRIKDMNG